MTLFLPQLPPKWSAALRDVQAKRPQARIAAAERLAQPSSEREQAQALAGLEQLCADADPRVRAAAVHALGELTDPGALRALRARLEDSDPGIRELAAVGLSELGWDVAGEPLRAALGSQYPELRFQALAAAAANRAPELPAYVLRGLGDPDAYVRASAAAAARDVEEPAEALLGKLREALGDVDIRVRRQAGIALAARGDAAAVEALLEATHDRELALEALDVAPELPDERVRERLAFMAGSVLGWRVLAAAAARGLARMGDPRGVRALRDLLRGFRTVGRALAAEIVGELELVELRPELERLAERPRGVDPALVAEALRRLREASGAGAGTGGRP